LVNQSSALLIGLILNGSGLFLMTGGKTSMPIAALGDIYRMVIADCLGSLSSEKDHEIWIIGGAMPQSRTC